MKKKNLFKVSLLTLFMLPVALLTSCKSKSEAIEQASTDKTKLSTEAPQSRATTQTAHEFDANFVGKKFSIIDVKKDSHIWQVYEDAFENDNDRTYLQEEVYEQCFGWGIQDIYDYGPTFHHEITLRGCNTSTYYKIATDFKTEDDMPYNVKIFENSNVLANMIAITGATVDYVEEKYVFPELVEVVSMDQGICYAGDNGWELIPNSNITNLFFDDFTYTAADIEKPNFESKDYNFPVDVNAPESIESILSKIHAIDETDGDVSQSVQLVSTTYDPNNLKLGRHELKVSVSDAAGNVRTGLFYITVFDIVKPVISGTSSYTRSYDDEITVEEVMSALTATDNFTTALTIKLKHNTYTDNSADIGNYDMVFTVSDEAGNVSDDFTVLFAVEDKKAPILTGPTTIELSNAKAITEAELRTKFTAHDEIDGDLQLQIEGFDRYSRLFSTIGNYNLKLSAVDNSGNIVSLDVLLAVKDSIQPDFYIYRDYVISIAKGTELTKDMIISYLSQLGEVDAAQVKDVSYELNNEEVGLYAVSVLMLDDSTYECSIKVGEINREVEKNFEFMDIFTANFWATSGKDFVANMWKPNAWNWLNWTAVSFICLIILAGLAAFLKKEKK